MEPTKMTVELTHTEPVLGTSPGNPETYTTFIESKRPEASENTENEAECLPAVAEELHKQSTVFLRTEKGEPFFYDYVFKGFFKDTCGMMLRVASADEKKYLRAYRKIIDGLLYIKPRQVVLNPLGPMTWNERPLRAQTAQGERICLARSEQLPAGTTCTFDVLLFDPKLQGYVEQWLDQGEWRGLGCWRNAGWGRFTAKIRYS